MANSYSPFRIFLLIVWMMANPPPGGQREPPLFVVYCLDDSVINKHLTPAVSRAQQPQRGTSGGCGRRRWVRAERSAEACCSTLPVENRACDLHRTRLSTGWSLRLRSLFPHIPPVHSPGLACGYLSYWESQPAGGLRHVVRLSRPRTTTPTPPLPRASACRCRSPRRSCPLAFPSRWELPMFTLLDCCDAR